MTFNYFSPFSNILSFKAPRVEGFLGYADGDAEKAAVALKDEAGWGSKPGGRRKRVGPISWRGQLSKPSDPTSRRHILSYHGPNARLLPTDFVYGSDTRHREVYMDGGLCAIAPGPVLGAALKSISNQLALVVVCLGEEGEAVYVRKFGGVTYGNDEAEMTRRAAMASAPYPDGWVLQGRLDTSGYDAPRTPWFFNQSGTEAQCMRSKDRSVVVGGGTETHKALDRLSLSMGEDGNVRVIVAQTPVPFEFSESGKVTDRGIWISPVYDEYEHYWHEKELEVKAKMSGDIVVAADYVGDELVLVRYVLDVQCTVSQDYMKGVDGDYLGPDLPDGNGRYHYRNDRGSRAATHSNPLKIGVDENARQPGDHTGAVWFNVGVQAWIAYSIGGTEYRIPVETATNCTETVFSRLPPNPKDADLFNRTYEIRYLRHLDVRGKGLVVFHAHSYDEMVKQDTLVENHAEAMDYKFDDSDYYVYMDGDQQQRSFAAQYHPALLGYPNKDQKDMWDEVSSWGPTNWSWTAQSYTGKRPSSNDGAEKGNLPVNSWFPEQSALYRNGWYGVDVVLNNQYLTEGVGFAAKEDGSFIVSGELPHPLNHELTQFIETEPESLAARLPGQVFNPVGEI